MSCPVHAILITGMPVTICPSCVNECQEAIIKDLCRIEDGLAEYDSWFPK